MPMQKLSLLYKNINVNISYVLSVNSERNHLHILVYGNIHITNNYNKKSELL